MDERGLAGAVECSERHDIDSLGADVATQERGGERAPRTVARTDERDVKGLGDR
jgi:hypothetical protein